MAKWDHLERSVPMLLSLAIAGLSFVGADVSGFFYNPDPQLFIRWHQLGIWYPFYRAHAHLETKRREPWLMGDEALAMVREAVTAPVMYSLAQCLRWCLNLPFSVPQHLTPAAIAERWHCRRTANAYGGLK